MRKTLKIGILQTSYVDIFCKKCYNYDVLNISVLFEQELLVLPAVLCLKECNEFRLRSLLGFSV